MQTKFKIVKIAGNLFAISDEKVKDEDCVLNDSTSNLIGKKIIAYLPKNDYELIASAKLLSLPLLPEMVVEDDVEKLAERNLRKESWDTTITLPFNQGYIKGYKAATKVYSEDDLKKAFNFGANQGYIYKEYELNGEQPEELSDEDWKDFIKSLKQPKTPVWFEAETTGGGEYLAGVVGGNEIWVEYPTELKTTTISGKQVLVGTYLYE